MMADNFPKLGKRCPHQDALTYDVLIIGKAETIKISKKKKRESHKTMSRFLSKTVRQWHDIFKALKESNCQKSFSWQ